MIRKARVDELVVERGFAESRNKAQALIMAGNIEFLVKGQWQKVDKAGHSLDVQTELRCLSLNKDVGRGAQKLRGALQAWPDISASEKSALDVGASTGGFTQVLLEAGAMKVVALDVGTHQLHERLRDDPRVLSVEQQHVLQMNEAKWAELGTQPSFEIIVTDLSFISLTKIIPTVATWLAPGGDWILLVKPQFEVGPKKAPKGIVREDKYRQEALVEVRKCVENNTGLQWIDLIDSPITGMDGNKEYLLWLKRK